MLYGTEFWYIGVLNLIHAGINANIIPVDNPGWFEVNTLSASFLWLLMIFWIFYFRCKACDHVITADDVEEWVYHQLEDTTHLLHGVIHANGYGHLLRVNGKEGGSRVLSGCHIMDFWDRLCKSLGVRLGFLYCISISCLLLGESVLLSWN